MATLRFSRLGLQMRAVTQNRRMAAAMGEITCLLGRNGVGKTSLLRAQGGMAILLVEQYFDFAREPAQRIAVMDRGAVVLAGRREELDERDVRRRLSV